jgi:hypothetical protein
MRKGWQVDGRGVPGFGDPMEDGVTEWAGWSIADREWWAMTSGDQQRSWFTNAQGAVAVADPDERHDLPYAMGTYNTYLSTPPIRIDTVRTGTAYLSFDSSWRPEATQTANLTVAFDGAPPIELFRWESDAQSPRFKPAAVNETIVVPMAIPAGAQSLVLTFGLFNCENNWWWAIDNVLADERPPAQD